MFSLWKLNPMLFFEADKGGGNTGTDPGSQTDAAKAKDKSPDASDDAKAGDDAKDKKPAVTEIKWTPEQQAEIDRIMGQTRKEERKKAKEAADADVAKAKKDAEEKELTEKQEFKTLAEKRLADIDTLKQENATLKEANEQAGKYKVALDKHLKAQTEKLPAHIKTLLSKLDVLEQMEYLTKNAKDLGVKLDSVDATPSDDSNAEAVHQAKQSKDMRSLVKSMT
jgi:hypothetical protein